MMRKVLQLFPILLLSAGVLLLAPVPSGAGETKNAPVTFASPDAAVSSLVDALRAKDVPRLCAVVGPNSEEWLFSGDTVADRDDWQMFLAAYDRKHALLRESETRVLLTVGDQGWTFPAPLVKQDGQWRFDTAAGREEAFNRRVGRNELDTLETLLAIVDAQREYAGSDPDGNGVTDYARRFHSESGKRDGLYWPTAPGAPRSPLGPLLAEAAREGYVRQAGQDPAPYHGYRFRLLTAQGPAAPGGAYDYLVGDRLLGGFAVVAYPAKYGVSGVMTFMVNHEGVVYEKDLGPATADLAGQLVNFNPDPSWHTSGAGGAR